MKPDTIICRCEDITYQDVLDAIQMGMRTVTEVKKAIRAGMGPCQGRTCGRLIAQIISQETGKPISEVWDSSHRPPLMTTPMGVLAGGHCDEE
ncbi:(2Fe-2S)-binding protein [candidate division KSB1 bacterium]|nr:(2Fe-2S)-binding protein [candidate division KSB1 bacterium]